MHVTVCPHGLIVTNGVAMLRVAIRGWIDEKQKKIGTSAHLNSLIDAAMRNREPSSLLLGFVESGSVGQ